MQGLTFPNRLLIECQHKFTSISIALQELHEVRGAMGEATMPLIRAEVDA